MKVFQNVRSTATNIPSVEVNVDTVYVRNEIKRVEEEDFTGWEYNEVQYPLQEYIETMVNEDDASVLALIVGVLMSEVDMLKAMIGGV